MVLKAATVIIYKYGSMVRLSLVGRVFRFMEQALPNKAICLQYVGITPNCRQVTMPEFTSYPFFKPNKLVLHKG